MLYRDIAKILGHYLFGLTLTLCVPFVLAIYYQFFADPSSHPQPHSFLAFFLSIITCLVLGAIFRKCGRKSSGHFYRREGLIAVVLIWFLTPAIAALPFIYSGTLKHPLQAYFEATSGFTTTGATTLHAKEYDQETGKEIPIQKVFCGSHTTVYKFYGTVEPVRDSNGKIIHEGIEAVSKALLFWRSFTQWFGGMGIIVLFVAILPVLGVGGKLLFQAEVPGPVKDALTPRIKDTAITLWKIYLGLSFLQMGALMITNPDIPLLDAVTITFSSVSTGGFTIRNASIGHWDNPNTELVVLIFMFLGSINFSFYFHSLRGKFYRVYEPELFLYIILLLLSCGFASYLLVGTHNILADGQPGGILGVGQAIRYGFFQIVSTHTSTGFVTADYDVWPYAVQVLMLITMFLGGMSGSTAGGMKIIRHLMLFRIAQYKVESLFRPENVRKLRVGKREVNKDTALMVLSYFLIVIAISVISTFIFVLNGLDPESALSLVALLINNIGIGFRMASPLDTCAFLSDFGLIFSSILMILGRLEFLAVLAVLVPAFWKQNS